MKANAGLRPTAIVAALLTPATAVAQIDQVDSPPEEVMEIAADDPGQEVARDSWRDRDHRHYGGYHRRDNAVRLSGGMAFTRDVEDGFFGRLEWVLLDDYRNGSGGTWLTLGAEGWGAEEAWGASLPYTINFGVEASVLYFSGGIGFDLFLFDYVYDDSGWGLFSPNVLVSLGLNFDGYRVGLDGRAKYRWQFGAETRSQGLVGLLFEVPL